MNDFFTLQNALAHAINADSVLCLAHVAAWLDPLRGDADDIDMPESEDDNVYVALHILRRAFPDIYFDALQAIRSGASYQQIDHLVCEAIQKHGIPLDSIEWIGWGIPLPAYGVNLDDPDFYTTHPDVIPVLACFGISPEPNPYNIVIPEVTYKAAEIIANDLLKREDEWRQVGWLIEWLFGLCGNTSVSWDEEMASNVQPLSWDVDDIEFAIEIIEEADGIMQDVHIGLEWINQHPAALEALQHNVRHIYKTIEGRKGRRNKLRLKLAW